MDRMDLSIKDILCRTMISEKQVKCRY